MRQPRILKVLIIRLRIVLILEQLDVICCLPEHVCLLLKLLASVHNHEIVVVSVKNLEALIIGIVRDHLLEHLLFQVVHGLLVLLVKGRLLLSHVGLLLFSQVLLQFILQIVVITSALWIIKLLSCLNSGQVRLIGMIKSKVLIVFVHDVVILGVFKLMTYQHLNG